MNVLQYQNTWNIFYKKYNTIDANNNILSSIIAYWWYIGYNYQIIYKIVNIHIVNVYIIQR